MLHREILLLTDYRNQFYEARRSRGASLDLVVIKKYFSELGYNLKVMQFRQVDFQLRNYRGCFILYQSSEDRRLLYKDFIEDVLLGLVLQGAIIIPDYFEFRAHHNKVFMEILRSVSDCTLLKGISSRGYGTFEEFAMDIDAQPERLVMKPSSGAASSRIKLKVGRAAQLRYARALSSSFCLLDFIKKQVNTIIRKDYRKKSLHRHKFVVQEYIAGLEGDYKVLVYGHKYYVLERRNRKNDFRASGSGKFSFPISTPPGLLDFASAICSYFNVPFISLDIAMSGDRFILLEFQFLCFGNYTLERSSFYFTKNADSKWVIINEVPDLEREFVTSVVRYIEQGGKKASLID